MRHDRAENFKAAGNAALNREASVKRTTTGIVAAVLAMSATAALAQSKPPLKLGGILDMSGLYADITGAGSETAAKMAVEDFGGEVLGRKVEIVAADHLNKADLAASIARDMLDNQGVEMLYDVAASATALAAGEIAKARNKIVMYSGPGLDPAEQRGLRSLHRALCPTTRLGRPTSPGSPPSSRASRPGSSSPPIMRSARTWKRTPPMWW